MTYIFKIESSQENISEKVFHPRHVDLRNYKGWRAWDLTTSTEFINSIKILVSSTI